MLVDTHHHFWNLEREAQSWMTEEHAVIKRTFEPTDLAPLLERVGVERTVLVQSACSDLDTDLMFEHAAQHSWIGGVIAWLDLRSPDRAARRLEQLRAEPRLRGFRHLIHNEPDPHWILQATVRASLASLEETGMILELPCVFPRHLGDVPELAGSHPGLTIVIDHLAKPPLGRDEMGAWAAQLHAAASYPNVFAKISGLNTILADGNWEADDLRDAVAVAVDAFGPERLVCGSDWPVALLNGDYEKVWRETIRVVRDVAPDAAEGLLAGNALRLYRLDAPHRHRGRGRVMAALTDQAIAEIKNLIMSGEFVAGSRLPKEQDLAQRLGLSRNSLREAVRALTLIGVLEPRVGDGTYVTSLEPELLLTGMGFISDLLTGSTLLELHQVRRILEPVATELATTQLDDADFTALENCLADMDAAETTQAFIAADEEFHRIVVTASGNSTLASLIQNLSGGTLRARLWRSVRERDAIEVTKRRHWDIYNALRDRDAKRAAAADLIHLSEGEQWLRQLMQAEDALAVLATVPPDTDLSGNGDDNAGTTRL